ncbi:MAG: AMP-binding protein, partial [Acidobacteria bacterium]|nr:AMP-binding protein [Acidobacteriota bacterium]
MMIGFPTETEAEAMLILELLKRIKWIHFPNLNILKIYPNTDMGKLALANGVSKDLIARSTGLAYHELPETLPFSKHFAREFQARLLEDYFLSKERLTHVLRCQAKIMTEDELVQKYDSYLPTAIRSFPDILKSIGISNEELGPIEFLPVEGMAASDFNEKIKRHYPARHRDRTADMFRVLLMDLSQWFRSESSDILYDVGAEPLGLMYLATYLHEQLGTSVEVKILKSRIDFDSYRELEREVANFKPHLIGLRTLSLYKEFFHRTVSILKHWTINVPIITGGPYATSDYRQLLQDYNIDLVVLGEGELTTLHLVKEMMMHNKQLPAEEILQTIPGLAYIREQDKKAQRGGVVWQDYMSRQPDHFPDFSAVSPKNINQPGDLLYLISTSGSTGVPKSVMLEHRTLVNLMHYQFQSANIDFSRVLQFAAIGFDVSLQEIFSALLTGGTVYLPVEDMKRDVPRLFDFIAKNFISVLFLPPAFLKFIFSEPAYVRQFPSSVRHIITAGEQLIVNESLRRLLKERGISLHNHYGPSETHVVTSLALDSRDDIPQLPGIGKPIANTKVYILDKYGNIQPIGIPGELCIGGIQVGRGYLNRPELTVNKFGPLITLMTQIKTGINKSFFGGAGGAAFSKKAPFVYHTGDMARWVSDGNIEFLGRIDTQVKIRGFRVELEEIENRITKHPGVKEAVVLDRVETTGDKYLCAYIVPGEENVTAKLREYLAGALPDYMIPTYFVPVERIPLTPNGKIDRNVLHGMGVQPGAIPAALSDVGAAAPGSEIEKKLAHLWIEILGRDALHIEQLQKSLGIDDNFFELGGHSLKTVILAAKIHNELHVQVPLAEIFKHATIRKLAGYIERSAPEAYMSIKPVEKKEY